MSELNLLISSLGRWISPLAFGSAEFPFGVWERSERGPVRQAETLNKSAKSVGLCVCLS